MANKENNLKFKREILLKDPRFANYQKDFLGVLFCKPEYSLWEAMKIVKKFFEGSEK